ncbi:hypothetical protein C8R43DRAFT_953826 [Mycena crocata]|nr:hypothetical protein C8R43DRAFT_953826 [Mycena crocata]
MAGYATQTRWDKGAVNSASEDVTYHAVDKGGHTPKTDAPAAVHTPIHAAWGTSVSRSWTTCRVRASSDTRIESPSFQDTHNGRRRRRECAGVSESAARSFLASSTNGLSSNNKKEEKQESGSEPHRWSLSIRRHVYGAVVRPLAGSVVLAWLGPETMALAWLCLALASENPSQSQSQQSWPGLVWLWLEPWLEFRNADPFPTSLNILTFFVQKGMSRFGCAQSEPRRMTPEYIPKLVVIPSLHCQIGHPIEAGSSHGFLAWLRKCEARSQSQPKPDGWLGLVSQTMAWLGLASGLKPKPAHHYWQATSPSATRRVDSEDALGRISRRCQAIRDTLMNGCNNRSAAILHLTNLKLKAIRVDRVLPYKLGIERMRIFRNEASVTRKPLRCIMARNVGFHYREQLLCAWCTVHRVPPYPWSNVQRLAYAPSEDVFNNKILSTSTQFSLRAVAQDCTKGGKCEGEPGVVAGEQFCPKLRTFTHQFRESGFHFNPRTLSSTGYEGGSGSLPLPFPTRNIKEGGENALAIRWDWSDRGVLRAIGPWGTVLENTSGKIRPMSFHSVRIFIPFGAN